VRPAPQRQLIPMNARWRWGVKGARPQAAALDASGRVEIPLCRRFVSLCWPWRRPCLIHVGDDQSVGAPVCSRVSRLFLRLVIGV